MMTQTTLRGSFLLVVGLLAGTQSFGQAAVQAKPSTDAGADGRDRLILLRPTAIPANARLEVDLSGGDYEVRPSNAETLDVIEFRDAANDQRRTTVHFDQSKHRARLTVDPPHGNGGPHVILELPRCGGLNIHLSAGKLVVTTPPCAHTAIDLHAGEVQAHLGAAAAYASIHASTTIGEVQAEPYGKSKGGFFNSVNASGAGQKTFTAHVFTGEITLME